MTSKQAAELYRRAKQPIPPELRGAEEMKRHKYNATKKAVDGIVFDSASEAEAYRVLVLWERAGEIADLVRQPVFVLQEKQPGMRSIKYVADFQFTQHGATRIVDVKGITTAAFRIKAKLFRAKFPDLVLDIWDRAKVKGMSRI